MKNICLKKLLLVLFFIFSSFAFAAEITFTPNFGFSLYSLHNYEQKNIEAPSSYWDISDNKGSFLFPTPTLGLDMSFMHENSGFTFILDNNFSFPTKLYVTKGFGNRNEKLSGIIWDGQMIFGYTYGVRQKTQITGGAGFGCVLGMLNTGTAGNNAPPYYNLGLALNFGYKYYFTDKIGINVNLYDLVGFSAAFLDRGTPSLSGDPDKTRLDGMLGLGNLFTLKIGVTFRL